MATLGTLAYVSTKPFNSLTCPPPTARPERKLPRLRCALSPPEWRESRRLVSLVLSHFLFVPSHAIAGGIFDKYVKKKKLDPLEAYVPAVILTQLQIKDLEESLEVDQPQYAACRSLLRSGPAASLRVNIRAVAQYASDNGNGKTASNSVDQCLRLACLNIEMVDSRSCLPRKSKHLRALEELDSLLLRASRNDTQASLESMKGEINVAVNALESLLQTVPSDVLDKGKAVADSYRIREDVEPETLDREMQQLESIL